MVFTTISHDDSKVASFYKGKRVLITGATGFLGKVILWKLFESCSNIDKIYLLIRSKRDQTGRERLNAMLKQKPFTFLQSKISYETLVEKTEAVEADLVAPRLGLSDESRQMLVENVNIIMHSAASVKFDAPLLDNFRDNVYGTRSILELCKEMKHLDCLVHVSTAYSNCQLDEIQESLYPLNDDAEKLCKLIESTPKEELDKLDLLENRPNTYTYTKAIAEHLVAKCEGKFPISIIRPSIVINSASEPFPGWVDNVNGIAGLGTLAAIGLLRTIDWNYYATSDMVPVDYVANCIICAARYTKLETPNKLTIYNMTSGNLNPVSWGVFFSYCREAASKTPPNKSIRPMIYSPRYNRVNPITLLTTKIFSELLFAYMIDIILVLCGYKKVLVKITKRMHNGYQILKPFTTKQWKFYSDNVLELISGLDHQDRLRFPFDMRDIEWALIADGVWKGARSELLKEELTKENIVRARRKQIYVTIAHYILTALFLGTVGFSVYKLVAY